MSTHFRSAEGEDSRVSESAVGVTAALQSAALGRTVYSLQRRVRGAHEHRVHQARPARHIDSRRFGRHGTKPSADNMQHTSIVQHVTCSIRHTTCNMALSRSCNSGEGMEAMHCIPVPWRPMRPSLSGGKVTLRSSFSLGLCTALHTALLYCTPAFTRRAQSSSPRPAGPVEHTAAPRCAVLHRRCLPAVSAHVPSSASLRRLPKGTATGTAGRARWRAARRRSAAVCAVCADLAGLVAVGDGGRRHAVLGPHRADLRRRAGWVRLGWV
jgi:hypothetical protein